MSFSALTNYYGIQPRHPSQLYAAVSEGLIPLLYLNFRFWYTQTRPGQVCGEFLILYSLFRIFNEVFREPDASLVIGLSRGQFYSIFLLGFGLLLWLYVKSQLDKAPKLLIESHLEGSHPLQQSKLHLRLQPQDLAQNYPPNP